MNKIDFKQRAKEWGRPFVFRTELPEFSWNVLHCRTEANRDSLGCGIDGRFTIGRKVAYPVENVCRYLEEKLGVQDGY